MTPRWPPPHIARVRRILRAMLPEVRRIVAVEALSGFVDVPVVRLRYFDAESRDSELTFAEAEATTLGLWLAGVMTGEVGANELPVAGASPSRQPQGP